MRWTWLLCKSKHEIHYANYSWSDAGHIQSMMVSNASASLTTSGVLSGRYPRSRLKRGSLKELVDSQCLSHSPTSHEPKRICKRRLYKLMSNWDLSLESHSESGSDSDHGKDEASGWVTQAIKLLHKGQGGQPMPLKETQEGWSGKGGSLWMNIKQMRSFAVESERFLKGLSMWQTNKGNQRAHHTQMETRTVRGVGLSPTQHYFFPCIYLL